MDVSLFFLKHFDPYRGLCSFYVSHYVVYLFRIDAGKAEVPEVDGLGFVEDISGSLHNLVLFNPKDIKCVESIVFSSFNPPPSYRK